jgi:hypothetical protein
MIELQRDGPGVLKKYISEHCTWITEVKEYDITDASGSFFINVFAEYGSAKGIHQMLSKPQFPMSYKIYKSARRV